MRQPVNPIGRVNLGQEGTGQAQILKPFDASRFPAQEMAMREEKKRQQREDAKDYEPPEVDRKEVPEFWKTEAHVNAFSDISNANMNATYDIAVLKNQMLDLDQLNPNEMQQIKEIDKEIFRISQDANQRITDSEQKFKQTLYHKEMYLPAARAYNNDKNGNNWSDDMGYLLDQFYKSDVETQSEMLTENGGNLFIPKLDYNKWRNDINSYMKGQAEKFSYSTQPDEKGKFWATSRIDGEKYDYDNFEDIILDSIVSTSGAINEIKRLPSNKSNVLEYTGKKDIRKVSDQEVADFLSKTDEGKDYLHSIMPPEWQRTRTTTREFRAGRGSSQRVIDNTDVKTTGLTSPVKKLKFNVFGKTYKATKYSEGKSVYLGATNFNRNDVINPTGLTVGTGDNMYSNNGELIDIPHDFEASIKKIGGFYNTLVATGSGLKELGVDGIAELTKGLEAGVGVPESEIDILVAGKDYTIEGYNNYLVQDANGEDRVVVRSYFQDPNVVRDIRQASFKSHRANVQEQYSKTIIQAGNTTMTLAEAIEQDVTATYGANPTPEQYDDIKKAYESMVQNGEVNIVNK